MAGDWWNYVLQTRPAEETNTMTWEAFKELFKEEYAPLVEVDRIKNEFLKYEQTNESVNQVNTKFLEMSTFCPELVATDQAKMFRYSAMLKTEIREFIMMGRCRTVNEMMELARKRELELETQGKKRKQTQTSAPTNKKFKSSDHNQERRQCKRCGRNHPGECRAQMCKTCGKFHIGECNMGKPTCHKCGKIGHISKDCRVPVKICFNCNQIGHYKTECPNPAVQAPATATLRISGNDANKKSGTPNARGRAFHLTAEEAKEATDVVTGRTS